MNLIISYKLDNNYSLDYHLWTLHLFFYQIMEIFNKLTF